MARKRIRPIELTGTVQALLKEYGEDVYEVVGECVDEVAKEAEGKLHSVDHFAPGRNPSGAYSKSWAVDKEPVGRFASKKVVHNEEHSRLTHLLEKGHVSRNGTHRTFGRVKAYPHIEPVNEWANDALANKVKQRLGK